MVSGGSDSTALAYIACELHERGVVGAVGMMHLDHQLRGEASDGDADFVQQLADALGVPLFLYSSDVGSLVNESGENLEAVARRERYSAAEDALKKLCRFAGEPVSAGRIFTAHTRNDRVENFYMRSIVGTGPGGFRSMLYRNGAVARPLLDVDRDELRDYLRRRGLDAEADQSVPCARDEQGNLWREDATNAHTDQFRGYVRNQIIPLAMARNPRLLETLCRSMNLIADEDDMLDAKAQELMERQVRWMERESTDGAGNATLGCMVKPGFGREPVPLQRRAMFMVLQHILGFDARVETRSVEAALAAFADGKPVSGYTGNIQGDLALSANKQGLRIEPMAEYRARRKHR
ncbi:MAG: tRNA lysidine(34) synthetase TilS [Eggerthellaceae bacterium]|nr:tRNA lysidine(34) synthetase TilS [Eggerthellaceae bacterium]